ncbi:L,D-transpeptidase family protein [Mesorhizobium sp. BR1-1-16]|uniref:L,D-transpeptidase family protein n=1 Tax=Mesorhizobium sp. BR1-1-16 TaxID=2876653 RepID=UPI001CCF89DC|nr:L,D-transpeptidase family protein [Mesorhizobium sp. BR1-1-16]MBZ9938006.1 L,D-transpeptidase family protein [Mesorhizobium sp. BR1-1-16]
MMSGRSIPCAIGRSGISGLKREGDGATPAARMALVAVLWRPDRGTPPKTLLPRRAIRPADGWCDAAFDANYNRPVTCPYPASHEAMTRDDALYDIVVVLDWNYTRRLQGRGSAIFLHLARPGFKPTEGCIAVTRADMRWLLGRVGRRARVRVRA